MKKFQDIYYHNKTMGLTTSDDNTTTTTIKQPLLLINKNVSNDHKRELRLNVALHRYFTYPGDYEIRAVGLKRTTLANSGFFMVSDMKSLQCFYCTLEIKSLRGWTNLDPFQMNAKHFSESLALNGVECPLMSAEKVADNIPMTEDLNIVRSNFESYRLLSLLKNFDPSTWVNVSVYDLARDGFYYSGESDKCVCYYCKLEVRGWEPGDSPNGEHNRWNSNCGRNNYRVTLLNVVVGSDEDVDQLKKHRVDMKKLGPRTILMHHPSIFLSYGDLGVSIIDEVDFTVKYAKFKTLHERLATFANWAKQMMASLSPQYMAEVGLFYTGVGDRVICFKCGGGLKDWALTDDPWEEHCKWFATCYLSKCKKRSQTFAESSQVVNTNNGSMLCKICKISTVDCVLLPCSHINSCALCAVDTVNCSDSGAGKLGLVKIYM